ncbi:hypothetical protein P9112_004323 [Eukaryota sp. TZLM1-RC]
MTGGLSNTHIEVNSGERGLPHANSQVSVDSQNVGQAAGNMLGSMMSAAANAVPNVHVEANFGTQDHNAPEMSTSGEMNFGGENFDVDFSGSTTTNVSYESLSSKTVNGQVVEESHTSYSN